LRLGRVTAVEEVVSVLPLTYDLGQNYPNPFNPVTVIPFRLGMARHVLLRIYNTHGRVVRTLIDRWLPGGAHEVLWDARDAGGRPVAAGIYLYRLEVGTFVARRKMVLEDGGNMQGGASKVVTAPVTFTVDLLGERILPRREEVVVEREDVFNFTVDERFLWTRKADMPTPRQEIAAATLESKIYVFGGLDDRGRSLDIVEVYDPRRDGWERKGAMPTPLNHLAAVAVGNRIIVFGGYVNFSQDLIISNQTWEYNPDDDTWERKTEMPVARGAHGAVVLDGRAYTVGGISPHFRDRDEVLIYDPASDTWSVGAPVLVLSEHLTVAAAAGRIYAISGREGGNRREVQAYDPVADRWEFRAPIPTRRSGITSVSWQGWIFVFGGELPGVFNQNEVYDPVKDSWESAPPMPTARHGLASGVVDGKIYVVGGGTVAGLRATGVVEEYVP
jgi:N-acetylneuraminic acid mutarotase